MAPDRYRIILEQYSKQIADINDIYNRSFNIFKVLKQEDQEIRHSAFLSWLFNTNASHGLGSAFADMFFKKCFGDNCKIDCNKIQSVKTEVRIAGDKQKDIGDDKKRIDILILGDDFTCTIENKYGSGEHGGQCKSYRAFIEGEFPNKNNYFAYLDIYKPIDYEENRDRYANFDFISYKDVKEILENTIGETDGIEAQFIRHYIRLLSEKYEPLGAEYEEVCRSIAQNDIQAIIDCDESKLTEPERIFARIVKKYHDKVKSRNDAVIYEILRALVKQDSAVKDDYGSGRKSKKETVKYAYALDGVNALFPKDAAFINTIDFTALGELRIDIYAGTTPKYSKTLADYICCHPGFCDSLEELKKRGWQCELSYRIADSSNYVSDDNHLLCKPIECKNNIISFAEIIKDHIVWRQKAAPCVCCDSVKECIDKLVALEEIGDAEGANIKEQIDKKSKNGLSTGLRLSLRYLLTGDITEENKESVKKTYREKTIEGLNLFELENSQKSGVPEKYRLGDKYCKKFFIQSTEDC